MQNKRLIAGLIATMTVITTVKASPPEFADVIETPYKSVIEYCLKQNITNGVSNNHFNPDAPISLGQSYLMAIRTFRPEDAKGMDKTKCQTYVINQNWEPDYFGDNDKMWNFIPSQNQFYEVFFKVMGLKAYESKFYAPEPNESLEMARAFNLPVNNNGYFTRAEACYVIKALKEVKEIPYNCKVKKDSIHIDRGYFKAPEAFEVYPYMRELNRLPDAVVSHFNKHGYKITIGDIHINSVFGNKTTVAGCYSYGHKNCIFVKSQNSIVHEFGHYVEDKARLASSTRKYYKLEKDGLESIEGSYCKKNSVEYFAEYFKAWIEAKADKSIEKQLKEKTPETYNWFKSLENQNWKLN